MTSVTERADKMANPAKSRMCITPARAYLGCRYWRMANLRSLSNRSRIRFVRESGAPLRKGKNRLHRIQAKTNTPTRGMAMENRMAGKPNIDAFAGDINAAVTISLVGYGRDISERRIPEDPILEITGGWGSRDAHGEGLHVAASRMSSSVIPRR
jgi:hypothetical protein